MAQETEPTLSITFRVLPGTSMLEARLPNGACFSVSPLEVHGKLGANLDLFRIAASPKSTDFNGKVCAPGSAFGAKADPAVKSAVTRETKRKVEDLLASLEIEL
jgi:hypothetical protein